MKEGNTAAPTNCDGHNVFRLNIGYHTIRCESGRNDIDGAGETLHGL